MTAFKVNLTFVVLCLMHCAVSLPEVITENATGKDGRIVGGQEIPIINFPHQISLRYKGTHICGGAILNETTIITAAHCVSGNTRPALFTIRAGSSEQQRGGVLVNIKSITPHEQYNKPTTLNNDIALLHLSEPLRFSNKIKAIGIVTKETVIAEKQWLFVSGWGATSADKQAIVPRLRYTSVQQQDQAKCARAYKGAGAVTDTMLCAGTERGSRDSCQGDSGGPLVTKVEKEQKLLGIVSWGMGCALKQYPGVYTRVAAYEQWIQQHMS